MALSSKEIKVINTITGAANSILTNTQNMLDMSSRRERFILYIFNEYVYQNVDLIRHDPEEQLKYYFDSDVVSYLSQIRNMIGHIQLGILNASDVYYNNQDDLECLDNDKLSEVASDYYKHYFGRMLFDEFEYYFTDDELAEVNQTLNKLYLPTINNVGQTNENKQK